MKGWVYILTNPSMPGIVKIGRTARTVHGRAGELYQTGVPTPFEVAHYLAAPDCMALERAVHEKLAEFRVGMDREFFRIGADDALSHLADLHREQVEDWLYEFLPEFTMVHEDEQVDFSAVKCACHDTDAHPMELASAIEYLSPEAVMEAVGLFRKHVSRRVSSTADREAVH